MIRTSPLPSYFRQKISQGHKFFRIKETLFKNNLHTVCEEAKCPNRTDCYSRGTLTFQILGNICTRRCGFCAEMTGRPDSTDMYEPLRILEAVKTLGLTHVVITAPARDDLEDGGASVFALTVSLLKKNVQNLTVEVLVSDFEGEETSIRKVIEAQPDIFNHNIETVARLTPRVRAKATYQRSLHVLRKASELDTNVKIKSGLMVGLGETSEEILQTFHDLRSAGIRYLTVGQYLQPSEDHLPIDKFYTIVEFERIKESAEELGFENVFCGPLIRSSYHADEMMGARNIASQGRDPYADRLTKSLA